MSSQRDLFDRMRALAAGRKRSSSGETAPRSPKSPTIPVGAEERMGVVDHVRYESPAGDFRVLSVRVDKATQTWVGKMPAVTKGQAVSATGKWVEGGARGPQFEVINLTPLLPSTEEGLRHFLVSLGVKGLGPKTVDKILTHFGAEAEAALDQPLLLSKVRGVTGDLPARLSEAWQAAKAERAIEIQLQQYGASSLLAGKIRAHYQKVGKDPLEVVQRDPYRLALDIDGVGFATADAIALKMGIVADSPERIRAGVLHVLQEGTSKGHVYLRRNELCQTAADMLDVSVARIDGAIGWLSEVGRVVIEPAGDHDAVYPEKLWQAECNVASRLLALFQASPARAAKAAPDEKTPVLGPTLATSAIASFEKDAGITLAPAQRETVHMAATHKVLVLTGGPGVGKSFVTMALLKLWTAAKLSVKLCAPTGRAAKRLSEATGEPATTIHRLLAWDPNSKSFEHHARNPIPTNVLLVDEVSMLDVALASQLLDAVPLGARVVLVGDVDQLPSVGPGAVLRDLIDSGSVPTVRLTEIFRQAKGSTISVNAALVNAGKLPIGDEGTTGAFYWLKRDNPVEARSEILSLVTERIPRTFGFKPDDIQVLTPMHKGEVGTIELNRHLQAALNPGAPRADVTPNGRGLRIGDRVIVTKNNRELDVSNGDIGRVVAVDPDNKDAAFTVDIDGREVKFSREDAGSLQLAYAISAHKSQGSGFPCVIVTMMTQHYVLLSRNLLYTAMTRGKKLVVLVADPRAVKLAVSEARKDDRNTRLAERLRAAVRAT